MRILRSELCKLKHSKILFGFFLLLIYYIVTAHSNAQMAGVTSKGYMVSITLGYLTFAYCLPIAYIAGALIFSQDDSWNTLPHLLTGSLSRRQTMGYKLLTLFVVNIGLETLLVLFAIALHLVTGRPAEKLFPEQIWLQLAVTFLCMSVWSIVAFSIVALTKSLTLGILIPFVFSLEAYLYPFCSVTVKQCLPNYHIEALLAESFTNLKPGATMLYFQHFGNGEPWYAHLLYELGLVTLMLGAAFLRFRREEVRS